MSAIPSISVIIPSNHGHHDLLKIVDAVCGQSLSPTEIIIVDSSDGGGICPIEITRHCAFLDIKMLYEWRTHALPGNARNFGLNKATSDLIAFIDVQTIPYPNWLEAAVRTLKNDNAVGVFGSTTFIAKTAFERLIRDAFFGVLPRKTLPGSVFKREIFNEAGHFIDWVRAGEDTEWMLRLDLMKISVATSSVALVEYEGLIGMSLIMMLKKWHRNYSASHELPHLFPQKLFIWVVLYPLIIFIGFNWNYLIANWHEDSPLYIAHITKIAVIFPIILYVIARGIFLPLHRGVILSRLLPIRFIQIAFISFMADLVKALVFSIPRTRRN